MMNALEIVQNIVRETTKKRKKREEGRSVNHATYLIWSKEHIGDTTPLSSRLCGRNLIKGLISVAGHWRHTRTTVGIGIIDEVVDFEENKICQQKFVFLRPIQIIGGDCSSRYTSTFS